MLLGLQDLGGKLTSSWGQVWPFLWVILKLSRAMVGHVEAICQMLFGHVVGFASKSALPQNHQDFKWVLASYVGSMWGSNARIEATFWAQIGAILGPVKL